MNQWSIIMDIYFENPTNRQFGCIVQTNPQNQTPADLYSRWSAITGSGGLAAPAARSGALKTNVWYRIAFAVDGTLFGSVRKYVNGVRVGVETPTDEVYLSPSALLFVDSAPDRTLSGYVNSIQVRDYLVSDSEIALLGNATAGGIPVYRLDCHQPGGESPIAMSLSRLDDKPIEAIPSDLTVLATSDVGLPLNSWVELQSPFVLSNGVLRIEDSGWTNAQRFYTVIRR